MHPRRTTLWCLATALTLLACRAALLLFGAATRAARVETGARAPGATRATDVTGTPLPATAGTATRRTVYSSEDEEEFNEFAEVIAAANAYREKRMGHAGLQRAFGVAYLSVGRHGGAFTACEALRRGGGAWNATLTWLAALGKAGGLPAEPAVTHVYCNDKGERAAPPWEVDEHSEVGDEGDEESALWGVNGRPPPAPTAASRGVKTRSRRADDATAAPRLGTGSGADGKVGDGMDARDEGKAERSRAFDAATEAAANAYREKRIGHAELQRAIGAGVL